MARILFLVFFSFTASVISAQTVTIYFEFNNFMLSNDARNTLDKFLASRKISSVGFFGHTDQVGGAEYNEWLSVQRALAVKDYLVSKGMPESSVGVLRGFGAERPITKDPHPDFQQLNRRVSVTNEYKPSSIDIAASTKQSAIHYTSSPALIKQVGNAKSTAVAAPALIKPSTNTSTETSAVKENTAIETSTKKENTAKKEADALKEIAAVKEKEEEKKRAESAVKTQPVAEVKTDKTIVADSAVVINTPPANEKKEVVKGSFADKLSRAVKPSASNTSANTSLTDNAPRVVKQQKHEKLIEDIKDKTTKEGENIVLRHIYFYGGRHAFLPQAYPALDDLLETMQKMPNLQIEIQGHICCQEGEGDQIDFDTGEPVLSVTRAKAVYDFLLDNGIDKKRMSYVGLAHKYPIIQVEANEAEATINRRVEIKIIKK